MVFFGPFGVAVASLGERGGGGGGGEGASLTLTSGLGLDDMSLPWPAVVQLSVFIYSDIQ